MSNRKYKLKERLKYTETCIENFLDIEKHRAISKKARPFLGFIFRIIYLPTRIWGFIYDTLWSNRYRKWCKEVEIIKQELESYE